MFAPEAAAALRWPWSSVLLPPHSRAPATQLTLLKLENKSKRNRISTSFWGVEILLASLDLWCFCFCDTASQMAPARLHFQSSFSKFVSKLSPSLFPPKDAVKLDLDGNLMSWASERSHTGTFTILLDSWHHFKLNNSGPWTATKLLSYIKSWILCIPIHLEHFSAFMTLAAPLLINTTVIFKFGSSWLSPCRQGPSALQICKLHLRFLSWF